VHSEYTAWVVRFCFPDAYSLVLLDTSKGGLAVRVLEGYLELMRRSRVLGSWYRILFLRLGSRHAANPVDPVDSRLGCWRYGSSAIAVIGVPNQCNSSSGGIRS